jgi:hypothetical protein
MREGGRHAPRSENYHLAHSDTLIHSMAPARSFSSGRWLQGDCQVLPLGKRSCLDPQPSFARACRGGPQRQQRLLHFATLQLQHLMRRTLWSTMMPGSVPL